MSMKEISFFVPSRKPKQVSIRHEKLASETKLPTCKILECSRNMKELENTCTLE